MARFFITGSADGLGKMAAELLIEQGHKVVLHARSAARGRDPQDGRRRGGHRRWRSVEHRGDKTRLII
jgi:NAD(P)-dependent dehydrogenase (short-subunit alcohol dehydrogenase family)